MIIGLILAPVAVPLTGAVARFLIGWRTGTRWLSAGSAALVLGAAVTLAVTQPTSRIALAGLIRVDPLSEFMLIVIGAVGLLATAATPGWLAVEIAAGRATKRTAVRHSVLVQLFLAAMAAAVLAASLGVVWIAIEGTTIVTAFLVGHRRTRASVEAAWKYVVICSTGIALALLGLLVLNAAAAAAHGPSGLSWAQLVSVAPHLDRAVTRIAVGLLIVGFGTKAGLAPLHAWLPDAHGQAPAPVSALMSGVLLSVAFYAMLRVKAIADLALGTGYARTLLVILALVSLLLAASLLIGQRDYKRMLAYSSIEHMSILALGAAAGGPLGLSAVLLHMLGHGLAKGSLFICAGQVLQVTGTHRISRVRALAAGYPLLAGCLGFGVLALLGFPPFSLFASEIGIARAGFAQGLTWPTAVALLLILVIAAALIGHVSRMLLGAPVETPESIADHAPDHAPVAVGATAGSRMPLSPGEPHPPDAVRRGGTGTRNESAAGPQTRRRPAELPVVIALAACAVIGVYAGPLTTLLHSAAAVLPGGMP
jgi:hydrogenase-4 component F